MATLDSLEPQRRAILELLLRQEKGYDDLAGMLDMPSGRVRELARDALISLEPDSGRRVDEDWRGQIADYVLGQQGGPEAQATRGHLKRSPPARTWVSSLLESLDHLYGDGARPDVPKPGGDRAARPSRGGGGHVAAGAAGAAAGAAAAATTGRAGRRPEPEDADAEETEVEESTAARERSPADRSAAAPAVAAPERTTPAPEWEGDRTGALSPEAEATAQNRRVAGGALAAAAVVAVVVFAIVLIGGDENEGKSGSQAAGGPGPVQPDQTQVRLVGQGRLASVGGLDAQGVAVIAERGGQNQLLVQARGLESSGRREAYEVWLYNSRRDAVSLGGQVSDQSGSFQGAGPLPPNFRTYRYIDISREKIDRDPEHSGESVLRVPVSDVLRGATAAGPGAPAVPGGGAAP